jgi:hypothetical protein
LKWKEYTDNLCTVVQLTEKGESEDVGEKNLRISDSDDIELISRERETFEVQTKRRKERSTQQVRNVEKPAKLSQSNKTEQQARIKTREYSFFSFSFHPLPL